MTEIREPQPLQIMWLRPPAPELLGAAFTCPRCGDVVDRENTEVHRQHHEMIAEMLRINQAHQHAIEEMRAQLEGFKNILVGLERGLKALTTATDGALDDLRGHKHSNMTGAPTQPIPAVKPDFEKLLHPDTPVNTLREQIFATRMDRESDTGE